MRSGLEDYVKKKEKKKREKATPLTKFLSNNESNPSREPFRRWWLGAAAERERELRI